MREVGGGRILIFINEYIVRADLLLERACLYRVPKI